MTDKALEAAPTGTKFKEPCGGCGQEYASKRCFGCHHEAIDWNRRAPLSALPGEAEVWGWAKPDHEEVVPPIAWRGSELPAWATSVFTIPLVTLASLQAMQARAEAAEINLAAATSREYLAIAMEKIGVVDVEWQHRAEAAEARVKELEDKYEPKERVFEFKGKTYRAVKSIEKGFYGQPINVIKVTALKGGSNG